MSGLYVHIPFCKSRCSYCGFYSTTLAPLADRYVTALCREIDLRASYFGTSWRTIYIGGGTPSTLTERQLTTLFSHIDCSCADEVTMECNPDDVTPEFANVISRLPINRVSMGAQTFSDERLSFLNRRHTSAEVFAAVERLRQAGIANISVDLMYGFPGETLDEWRSDIDNALRLDVEHLSAYALMYEEGTPLYNMLRKGRVEEVDEELSRAMFYELKDRLHHAGYEHYEISNFARPNRRSRHNSSYWKLTPYMGIGAAAHSYDGTCRQWNVADIKRYIETIERGEVPAERETLDNRTRYNDTVMLSLRTCEGIDLRLLERRHGQALRQYCERMAKPYIDNGLLVSSPTSLRLSREGLFVSDMVMADLMAV